VRQLHIRAHILLALRRSITTYVRQCRTPEVRRKPRSLDAGVLESHHRQAKIARQPSPNHALARVLKSCEPSGFRGALAWRAIIMPLFMPRSTAHSGSDVVSLGAVLPAAHGRRPALPDTARHPGGRGCPLSRLQPPHLLGVPRKPAADDRHIDGRERTRPTSRVDATRRSSATSSVRQSIARSAPTRFSVRRA